MNRKDLISQLKKEVIELANAKMHLQYWIDAMELNDSVKVSSGSEEDNVGTDDGITFKKDDIGHAELLSALKLTLKNYDIAIKAKKDIINNLDPSFYGVEFTKQQEEAKSAFN